MELENDSTELNLEGSETTDYIFGRKVTRLVNHYSYFLNFITRKIKTLELRIHVNKVQLGVQVNKAWPRILPCFVVQPAKKSQTCPSVPKDFRMPFPSNHFRLKAYLMTTLPRFFSLRSSIQSNHTFSEL